MTLNLEIFLASNLKTIKKCLLLNKNIFSSLGSVPDHLQDEPGRVVDRGHPGSDERALRLPVRNDRILTQVYPRKLLTRFLN